MVRRDLATRLSVAASRMPAVAVTGPRQAGKTTLCRQVFPEYDYVSLEPLDNREFAETDPRGLIERFPAGVIIDEVQRVPTLFSYLQEAIDHDPAPGRFILTGSQVFGLSEEVTQSLAGRIELLQLLPLTLDEVARFHADVEQSLWRTVWTGGYPRIHDRRLDPAVWLRDYIATYVQRDVRQVLNVSDLATFATFLRLAAARTGQELNLSNLGADVGVSYNTIRAWISVLEASYIVIRLPPWHRNLRKRAVRAPKLHFLDSGVVCQLLGIRDPNQLMLHPLRGPIFESWVTSEILKARLNEGGHADLYHLREDRGSEVDLLVDCGRVVHGVEVKSGATIAGDMLDALLQFSAASGAATPETRVSLRLVHGGESRARRRGIDILPWNRIHDVSWS